MSVDTAEVISAKVKIKEWEREFTSVNMRVPEALDIKTAPDDVRGELSVVVNHFQCSTESLRSFTSPPGSNRPGHISACDLVYFKHKKQCQREEAEARKERIKKVDVWGAEFNVSQASFPNLEG